MTTPLHGGPPNYHGDPDWPRKAWDKFWSWIKKWFGPYEYCKCDQEHCDVCDGHHDTGDCAW